MGILTASPRGFYYQFGLGRFGVESGAVAEGPAIVISTDGATFAPQISVDDGAVVLWTFSDASTSNSETPEKDFGSAAARQHTLLVTPWKALKWASFGYDRGDGGSDEWPLVAAQNITALENLASATHMEALMLSNNTQITGLSIAGMRRLKTVEAYLASNLATVDMSNIPSIERLCFENCDLVTADLSGKPLLQDWRGARNTFTTFDLGEVKPDMWHFCSGENPTMTENYDSFEDYDAMEQLWIPNAAQTGLLECHSPVLDTLQAENNRYTSADFSGCWTEAGAHVVDPGPYWGWGRQLDMSDNDLTSINIDNTPLLQNVKLQNNQLPTAQIDYVLATLDAAGLLNGYVDLTGDLMGYPSAAGLVSAASLEAKGWTVSVATCPVTFTVTAGKTVTIGLAVKAGTTAVINWGDGSTSVVANSGSYQIYTRTYAASGTYVGLIENAGVITHLRVINETKAVFNFTRFRSLTFLNLNNIGSSVTGVITGMPLTYLLLRDTGTAVTGVITGMPLTYLYLVGTGTAVSGVLATTARLTREFIDIAGEITLPTSRIYGTWGAEAMRIDMDAHKLTAEETNATLIRLAASPISGSNKTVYIYGQARTSASDAAATTLNNAGVTVTITG